MSYLARGAGVVALCVVAGCGVETKNQTPGSFPYLNENLPVAEAVLYPASTPAQLRTLIASPAHRFLLEAKPWGGASNVRVAAVVDGTEHAMSAYGGSAGEGLFVYEAQPQCVRSYYDFYFVVRYRAGWLGEQTTTLGSATAPVRVEIVRANNSIVWYVPGTQPAFVGSNVKIVNGVNNNEVKVTVQNLSNTPTRIALIAWGVSEADRAKFQLLNLPSYTREMGCGDSATFTVKWNPVGTDLDDMARFGIQSMHKNSSGGWDFHPQINITARGVIGGS